MYWESDEDDEGDNEQRVLDVEEHDGLRLIAPRDPDRPLPAFSNSTGPRA